MIYEGFTEPRYDIMVAATEIGRLEDVLVEVGDRVQQGQTIARLEDSLQASSVKIAKLQAEIHGEADAARAEAFLRKTRYDQIRELAADKMARPNELLAPRRTCKSRKPGMRPQRNSRPSANWNSSDMSFNWLVALSRRQWPE